MPKTIAPVCEELRLNDTFRFEDHFLSYTDAQMWTKAIGDTGTVAASDALGGVLVITPSDGTAADNDQASIQTTQELFLFAADKPFAIEFDIQYAEAATNVANVAAGVMNAFAADRALVDGGLGPVATTHSSAMIYKVDGATVWKAESCVVTTQTISTSDKTAGGTPYQRLRIDFQPTTALQGEVTFWVDGAQLVDSTTGKPIKHTVLFASATEMAAFVTVKNGSAVVQPMNVHRVAFQGRA